MAGILDALLSSDEWPSAINPNAVPGLGLLPYRRSSQDVPDDDGSAASAAPASAGQSQPTFVPEASLLGRLRQGLSANANTLMALGAGLAGARTWGEGISRGLATAVPAAQAGQRQQAVNQTAAVLMKRGLPSDLALASATNPALMRALLPHLFGAKRLQFQQVSDPSTGIVHTLAYDAANPSETYRLDPRQGLVPMGGAAAGQR